jgi:hypothetical protein
MMFAATAAAVAAARAMETTVSAVAATAATEAPTATETEAVADVGSLNVCSKAVITIVWILAIHKSVLAIHKSVLAIHKSVLHKSVFRTLDVVHSVFYSGSCQASFSGIRFFLRNPRNSTEHTSELNHSRARFICSGIRWNPEFRPEFWRKGRTRDLCPPQYRTILPFFCNLPHHSMLPVVPGPQSPSSPPTAAVRRLRHPQLVDAETERRGRRIRNIEFKVLM